MSILLPRELWFSSKTHSFRETRSKHNAEEKGQVQIVLMLITLESLKSNSSQEPRASGKRDALFSSRSDEPGNQFESSMFKFVDPSKLRRYLLEGNKDHLLSEAKSELMRQEHQVESLNSCINELQQQAYAQGLELQDARHGYLESRREQSRVQEELSMKEKTYPRYSDAKYS